MGGNAGGGGSRKLASQEISRRSSFRTIASKGENKHVNEANLAGMAPWLGGKSPVVIVMARLSLSLKVDPQSAMPKLRCPPRSLTELQT